MPYIKTRDGTRLYAKIWGEGRPVVLIHGWPLTADSWDFVSDSLARAGCRVIAYDRRGFGRSDQPWNGYDYDTLTDDLADVMQDAQVDQDAALIGFSMGGGEVARYMTRHQGRGVSRAALISSVVPYLLKTESNPDGVPEKKFDDILDGLAKDRAKFLKSFLNDFFGIGLVKHPVSDELVQAAWAMCMQAGLRPTLECVKAFSRTDFRDDLQNFKVPTLVIHGTADKTVPIQPTARQAAAAIPSATLIEYEGAPHGLFATEQDRLVRDLLAFLDG